MEDLGQKCPHQIYSKYGGIRLDSERKDTSAVVFALAKDVISSQSL